LRYQQAYVAANDVKYNVIAKNNNVDTNMLTYYKGNIGIGTTAPLVTTNTTRLHIYNAVSSRILLDTTTTGTAALEFRRGTGFDIQQDFRFINDTDSTLKLQYENNQQAYADSVAQLMWVLPNVTSGLLSVKMWKNTEFVGNVGIGTLPSTTVNLDIVKTSTTAGDLLNMRYDTTNGLRFQQAYVAANDVKYNIIQKANNVDINALTFYKGNIGINTTTPLSKLHIENNSTALNPVAGVTGIYVNNPTNSAGQNSVITNRIGGSAAGRCLYSLDVSGSYGFSMFMAGNSHALRFNNNWEGAGTDVMVLNGNGNVSVNNELTVSGNKLVITGGSPTLYLRDTDSRVGMIHVNSNIFYILGGAANQDTWTQVNYVWPLELNLTNNNAFFGGNVSGLGLTSRAAIDAQNYILTYNGFYARSSYDARMYCNSSGMFIDMGDIGTDGNPAYLRMGAYNGVSNIESGSNRNLHLIVQNGAMGSSQRQLFQFRSSGECMNSYNWTTWNQISDQRVKENIKKADLKICFNNVKNINLYRFNYINGFSLNTTRDKTQLGFIAQQVSQHFPKSVLRSKTRIEDKREINDLASVSTDQINFTLFGAVKQLIKVVEKQNKRIKKLEELLNIIDDDEVEDDTDEPYIKIECDEVDINTIEPSEPEGV
jgi:hypothetical protein